MKRTCLLYGLAVDVGLVPFPGSEVSKMLEKGGSYRHKGLRKRLSHRARPFMGPAKTVAAKKGLLANAIKGQFYD